MYIITSNNTMIKKAIMVRDDWYYIQQQKKLVESVLKELKEDEELSRLNIRDIKQFTEYQFREYLKNSKQKKES